MSRIEMPTGRGRRLLLKALNALSRRTMGAEVESMRLVAHKPSLLLPFMTISQLSAGKSRVDPHIRILAAELTAHRNGCAWCMDYGRAYALEQGVPVEKLDALEEWRTSPLFSPAERAALALSDSITHDVHVPDDVWAEAQRHFSQVELTELVLAVAVENFYNRVNGAFAVEAQGFCELPRLRAVA